MSDEEMQTLRRAASQGDMDAAARVSREDSRRDITTFSFLEGLIGEFIYIEGVRINYRGTLVRVLRNGDGAPSGLILTGMQRVSYFNKTNGPEQNYTFTHTEERLVPYDCVHDVGKEGFKAGDGNWRKS